MQKQLTEGPLYDASGRLHAAGFSTYPAVSYNRSMVRASALRLKEWDYYYVGNDAFGIALTVADNGYMGLDSISLLDFEHNWQITHSWMQALTLGAKKLPPSSDAGQVCVSGKGYEIHFDCDGQKRSLYGYSDPYHDSRALHFDLELTDMPRDSMVILTPFPEDSKAFYYNRKINCMRAEGQVRFGDEIFSFAPAVAFGVLDWGRGVWTYDNTWYWGSASGICDGHRFGFNIGYGFGDTSAASENMLFWDGIASKLEQVDFHIPGDGTTQPHYMEPWSFSSSDGRFEMDFVPIMDRSAKTDFKILLSDQHQVFGRFSGTAVLDSGQVVEVKNLLGFAEKVHNKW